jgi:hypothetical protein
MNITEILNCNQFCQSLSHCNANYRHRSPMPASRILIKDDVQMRYLLFGVKESEGVWVDVYNNYLNNISQKLRF